MNPNTTQTDEQLSFNDPAGFVFCYQNQIYRGIFPNYAQTYTKLVQTGLYAKLVEKNMLVAHQEVELVSYSEHNFYKIIQPKPIPFISYPCEWSFSMLKDAALLSLEILVIALEYGFVLKDAKADNVQFVENKPIFIDTLSFVVYEEGTAWVAYRQFCQQFLAPLALMSCTNIALQKLQIAYIDGIPLQLATQLLPFRTKWRWGIFQHLILHSWLDTSDNSNNIGKKQQKNPNFTKHFITTLAKSLHKTITNLQYKKNTNWYAYYQIDVKDAYLQEKKQIVQTILRSLQTKTLWDLGTNTGLFAQMAVALGIETIAFDADHDSIEVAYQNSKNLAIGTQNPINYLTLLVDLQNPTAARGWANKQYKNVWERGNLPNTVLALALIHHLRIVANIPVLQMADFFAMLCQDLLIEFVPKTDEKVQRLLQNKEDVYADYTEENFEKCFTKYFQVAKKHSFANHRILYHFRK
jgi:ribosomal protein L11 methylase PrmA